LEKPPHGPATLFAVPEAARSRTSDVLLALIERARQPDVTLRTLTDRLGDRTFGMLLILVAMFNLIPFISLFAGLLITVLGVQMALGMRRARLPKSILDRQLPPERVRQALAVFEPRVRAMERFVRPRWRFTEAPIVDRCNGLVIALLGLVVAIPFPFTNLGPALVVVIMGLGLMERDGLVQLGAAAVGLAGVALLLTLFLGG